MADGRRAERRRGGGGRRRRGRGTRARSLRRRRPDRLELEQLRPDQHLDGALGQASPAGKTPTGVSTMPFASVPGRKLRRRRIRGPARRGREVDLLRRSLLDDGAVPHQSDPVGEREASSRSCVTSTTVTLMPRRIRASSSRIVARRCGSMLTTARRAAQLRAGRRARASATRCCWPPESLWGYRRRAREIDECENGGNA